MPMYEKLLKCAESMSRLYNVQAGIHMMLFYVMSTIHITVMGHSSAEHSIVTHHLEL